VSTVTYALEHFYYGQSLEQPDPEPQLLAKSQGIVQEQVDEAAQHALVPPADTPTGSWALIRGKQAIPFVMVQAQTTPTNQTVWHFIIMPTDVLRAIGGNLKAIIGLAQVQMPAFQKPVGKLQQLLVDHPEIVSSDEQIEDILERLVKFPGNHSRVAHADEGAAVRDAIIFENIRLFHEASLDILRPRHDSCAGGRINHMSPQKRRQRINHGAEKNINLFLLAKNQLTIVATHALNRVATIYRASTFAKFTSLFFRCI